MNLTPIGKTTEMSGPRLGNNAENQIMAWLSLPCFHSDFEATLVVFVLKRMPNTTGHSAEQALKCKEPLSMVKSLDFWSGVFGPVPNCLVFLPGHLRPKSILQDATTLI